MVHGIELHAAFEERENKQKNANFYLNCFKLSFFSHKNALVMQFCVKRKITLNLRHVYKQKWLVPMFTNKDFYE